MSTTRMVPCNADGTPSLPSPISSYCGTLFFSVLKVAVTLGIIALAVLAPYAAIMAVISMPLFPIIATGIGISVLSAIALIFMGRIEAIGHASAKRCYTELTLDHERAILEKESGTWGGRRRWWQL
jgi:hypothetical protein